MRAFLSEKLTSDLRDAGRKGGGVLTDPPGTTQWRKALYAKGWIALAWPREYEGPGWTEMQRYIFSSEVQRNIMSKLILGMREVPL